MIRNLTGLFKKLLDRTEKIIIDESTILDDYVGISETMILTDTISTRAEDAPPFYWAPATGGHSEMKWNFSQWG